jgi:polar amino acid transport system substrate-binding protein
MKIILPLVILTAAGLGTNDAAARSLDTIRELGAIGMCAHPNSLPFASKAGDPPGFQIEMGRALAAQLGVALKPDWILTMFQMRSADCDIVLDTIADREAQGETNLRLSKPYYRTGVVLVVRADSALTSFADLNEHTKVGVQVGSMAAMVLSRRHVSTSTYGFEVDSLDAVAGHEIDAATVTPSSAGYYNLTHPDHALRSLGFDDTAPELSWNVAVGMVRPDDKLREAIDAALDHLNADGTIERVYAHYGIALQAPK